MSTTQPSDRVAPDLTNRSLLGLLLLCGGCSSGGGSSANGGQGSLQLQQPTESPPVPQNRSLVLIHEVSPRTLPSEVITLRLQGTDEDGALVFGPQTFIFEPVVTLSVPRSIETVQIEYLDASGIFGRFTWRPIFDGEGEARLVNPNWEDVSSSPSPTPDPTPFPLPSAEFAPQRALPERCWGADRYLAISTDRPLNSADLDTDSDVYVRGFLLDEMSLVTENANGSSGEASISEDGRWVVFSSAADNLVEGDSNGQVDIFLFDSRWKRMRNITSSANADSGEPTISADGSVVAFVTAASNLVDEDSDPEKDILLYRRETESLTLATDNLPGPSCLPSLNQTGSELAFVSKVNAVWQVIVRDENTGTPRVASSNSGGTPGNGDSFFPSFGANNLMFSSVAMVSPYQGQLELTRHMNAKSLYPRGLQSGWEPRLCDRH